MDFSHFLSIKMIRLPFYKYHQGLVYLSPIFKKLSSRKIRLDFLWELPTISYLLSWSNYSFASGLQEISIVKSHTTVIIDGTNKLKVSMNYSSKFYYQNDTLAPTAILPRRYFRKSFYYRFKNRRWLIGSRLINSLGENQ